MKWTIVLFGVLACTYASAQPQYEPHAIWQREGAGDSSLYGTEILALGDQNNDGYNDWAIYAAGLGYAPPGSPNEPKVEFFHGGNPPDTVPYMVRVADRATEVGVRGARALGDLNGDGYVDWYIFTTYVGDSTGRHIYKIYFGGPGSHEVSDLILISPILSGYDPIGDFNGDGFDDVLLSDGHNDRAAIFYGGNPMDTLSDWSRSIFLGGATSGKLNGDRFSDFATYESGYVGIYLGSSHPDTIPAYHWSVNVSERHIISDLNADGFDDLCLSRSGWGEVLFGGVAFDTVEDARLTFPCYGGPEPGGPSQIVSAGDFNHDGYGDAIMLTKYCSDSWYGTMTLHLGHPTPSSEPAFVVYGWTDPFNLIGIRTASNLGDVNGDGTDDLAVGANDNVPHAGWRGKVVILAGDTSLHAPAKEPRTLLPENFAVSAFPNPFNYSTTIKIHVPTYRDEITLALFNTLGQCVQTATLHSISGTTTYVLDGTRFSTGLYLLQASSGSSRAATKLVLLK